nr:tetratricopeptide repeat protein [Bacteroidota bacterium]
MKKNTTVQSKPKQKLQQPKVSEWMYAAILFVIAFAFYANSISNGFALDDLIVITANKFTQQGVAGIKDIMTHDAFVGTYGEALNLSGGRYRPLSIVSFAIEKQVFGNNTSVYHFFNVLFYSALCALLFIVLRRLFAQQNIFIPFVASLLFTIHPIHTEVVANIKSRDEIYMLFFSVLTLYFLLKDFKWKIIAACFTFFLALLSKENAITVLFWMPLAFYLFKNESIKTLAVKFAPLIMVAAIYLFMRAEFAGMVGDRTTTAQIDDSYLHATFIQKLATIAWVQLKYIGLLLIPYSLSWDYSFNQLPLVSFTNPVSIISLLIHLGAIIYAIIYLKKKPIISFSILFYMAAFFLVSNLVFNVGTSMAERFAFLPSVPFCLLVAGVTAYLLKIDYTTPMRLTATVYVALSLIIVVAAAKVIPRNKDWKDNFTLYAADVSKVPNSARSRLFYGIECIGMYQKTNDRKWINDAIANCKLSSEIDTTFHFAYHNLGVAYQTIGDYTSSIPCYENVLKYSKDNAQAYYGLGTAYGKGLQQYDKAKTYFVKLIDELKLTNPEYYEALGLCYALQGNGTQAIDILKRGIEKNPRGAKLYYNTAITYANMLRADSSEYYFNIASSLDPSMQRPKR